MRTMMMTLAILISACGVDDPKTVKLRNTSMGSAMPQATTDPTAPADETTDEPQVCFFSTDCDVGTCDRQTHTCVGDEPIQHTPDLGD